MPDLSIISYYTNSQLHVSSFQELWWRPAEREVIPHRHLASPSASPSSGCPFSSRQVQALVSPTCDTPHSLTLHRSPTTPTLAPPTPATPMSPLDALRRLQVPPDLSPPHEEDIHIQEEITLGEGSTLLLESEAEEEEEEAQLNERKTAE